MELLKLFLIFIGSFFLLIILYNSPNLTRLIYWKIKDLRNIDKNLFAEYGLTLFCGRQGAGKTIGMVDYLERMRKKYPKLLIYTNFHYKHQHGEFQSWRDFLELRNGTNGILFAIDEIQNEYNSTNWKDFPETLLSEITQQRKQRVKIIGSSQVFTRVVKQLREQCYEVVECKTLFGRWTFLKCYDGEDYNAIIDSPEKKQKLHKLWRRNFVQSDELRNLYDSYAKVERLKKLDYIPRNERVS